MSQTSLPVAVTGPNPLAQTAPRPSARATASTVLIPLLTAAPATAPSSAAAWG